MSELYLIHSKKGTSWFKKDHKYISREKIKGKWRYTYKEKLDARLDLLKKGKLLPSEREIDVQRKMKKINEQQLSNIKKSKEIVSKAKEIRENKRAEERKEIYNKIKIKENKIAYKQKAARINKEQKDKAKKNRYEAGKVENERIAKIKENRISEMRGHGRTAKIKEDRISEMRGNIVVDYFKNNKTYDIYNKKIKRKDRVYSIEEDAKVINPNFSTHPSNMWNTNCGSCTAAYILRRKGYDVEAVDNNTYHNNAQHESRLSSSIHGVADYARNDPNFNPDKDYYWYGKTEHTIEIKNIFTSTNSKKLKDKKIDKAVENIKKMTGGNEGYGTISPSWITGSSHILNWEIDENNNIKFIDTQNGKIMSESEFRNRYGYYILDYEIVNYTNLTIDEDVLELVKERK